jgi:acid stress-induced BolA-like protein IbaG/YrbA
MEDFMQRLTDLLRQQFANCELEIEPVGSGRIGGFLIWDGFTGREQIDRQREVWRVIRSSLDAHEQRRVSAILTLTPEEMASARQG